MAGQLHRGLVVCLCALAFGCRPAGPTTQEEFVSAYKAAYATGKEDEVYKLVAWIDDVLPNLQDPYDGGYPARLGHRKAIKWGLTANITDGKLSTVEVIDVPEQYADHQITPAPLYWLKIVTNDDGDKRKNSGAPLDIQHMEIEIPVIQWKGAHYFYGSPDYIVESTFGFTK
ncbi:hypothetical protein Pan97_44920 [Bremerella volcania]|uniref:Uncharacterized protein n=1 Tax=Bremerella volcania TaxID=2527984 RepID=A0A518CDX9_9BACT|nr:hypothetical protein [Bremerella volcania]QDU77422.1 hypothetical protein Pan97_44920 [Bremerella volcania]